MTPLGDPFGQAPHPINPSVAVPLSLSTTFVTTFSPWTTTLHYIIRIYTLLSTMLYVIQLKQFQLSSRLKVNATYSAIQFIVLMQQCYSS